MTEATMGHKVFGIGLNKTGTTTLGKCGEILGYRCTGGNRALLEDVVLRKDLTNVRHVVSQNDLFEDWPYPLIYKELDQLSPNSKFVLTVRRDPDTWLKSLENHSMRTHPTRHFRKLVYGHNYPHHAEREHLEFYSRHNDEVRAYFKSRKTDFIEVCWENGDGFARLCRFLGREIPDTAFPHVNRGVDRKAGFGRILANRLLCSLRV